jgi:YfiH family protein
MTNKHIQPDWNLSQTLNYFQSDTKSKILKDLNLIDNSNSTSYLFKFFGFKFNLIHQTHSAEVVEVSKNCHNLSGDSIFTREKNVIVAVRTADCVPILLSDKNGSFVAAIHCGWRGIAKNILKKTIKKINSKDYIAWIGPGISQSFFTTDRDVFDAFMVLDNRLTKYFKYTNSKFYVNLFGVVEFLLKKDGVDLIYGNSITQDFCTFRDDKYFFSYRRDQTPYRLISAACIKS